MSEWHLGMPDGKQEGPLTLDDLRARVRKGDMSAESLVWRKGMAQWTPAGQQPELAKVLASDGTASVVKEIAAKSLQSQRPWMTARRFRFVGRICAILAALGVLASMSLSLFGKSYIAGSLQLGLAFLVCEGVATILDRLETSTEIRGND